MNDKPEVITSDQETHLQGELNRAGHAERIMLDEIFLEAVNTVRESAQAAFENSDPGEVGDVQRRDAHLRLTAITQVCMELDEIIRTGKLAQKTLGWWADQKRRIRDRLVA